MKVNKGWISESKTPYLSIFCFSKDRKHQTNLNAQMQDQDLYNEASSGLRKNDEEENLF